MGDLIGRALIEITIPFDFIDEFVSIAGEVYRDAGIVLEIYGPDHADRKRFAIGILKAQTRGLAHLWRIALERIILVRR